MKAEKAEVGGLQSVTVAAKVVGMWVESLAGTALGMAGGSTQGRCRKVGKNCCEG